MTMQVSVLAISTIFFLTWLSNLHILLMLFLQYLEVYVNLYTDSF